MVSYNVQNLSDNDAIGQEPASILQHNWDLFNARSTHGKKWLHVQTQTKTIHLINSQDIYKSWMYI